MVSNLVSKYGLVPQVLYPDSWNARDSSIMDSLLTTKLRQSGWRLRALASQCSDANSSLLARHKAFVMQDIVRILTLSLGPPPSANSEITWEYYTKDGAFRSLSITPLDFARSLNDKTSLRACNGTDVHNLFSLVHDPRNEYYRHLTVEHLGNVRGGSPITYINVPMGVLKEAAISMIKKGYPVFVGSDVEKTLDRKKGIMGLNLVDYHLGYCVDTSMTKAERLMTNESAMTHAMILTAVHLDGNGKSVRWRIENSWGNKVGAKGYFVMSNAWMDEVGGSFLPVLILFQC